MYRYLGRTIFFSDVQSFLQLLYNQNTSTPWQRCLQLEVNKIGEIMDELCYLVRCAAQEGYYRGKATWLRCSPYKASKQFNTHINYRVGLKEGLVMALFPNQSSIYITYDKRLWNGIPIAIEIWGKINFR